MQPPWTKSVDYSAKPIFVCWETTKSCLLSCRHCRATAIKGKVPGELDHDSGLRLIDQLVEFGEPYPALLLTGGDPLMRSDVFDLIRYARGLGIYTAVAASVTPLLDRERIERLRDLGVEIISVSLDGATAASPRQDPEHPGHLRRDPQGHRDGSILRDAAPGQYDRHAEQPLAAWRISSTWLRTGAPSHGRPSSLLERDGDRPSRAPIPRNARKSPISSTRQRATASR